MKTNVLIIFAVFVMASMQAFSQTYLILAKPMESKDWGYANLKGEFVIQPMFRNSIGFSADGYAAVYDAKTKQFYFINTKGEILNTEFTGFKLIEVFGFGMKGFQDGFAPVKYGDKWGYLNTSGKLAVAATFDKITPFNGFGSGQKEGKFYVIDKSGAETVVDIPGLADINEFAEGFATFKAPDGKIGYIDGTGKIIIPAKFQSAGDFSGGLAWAKEPDGLVGYIDKSGAFVVPPKFEGGKNYDPGTGLARVKIGGEWAYTNNKGELTFVKDTEIWEDFFNGLARGKKSGLFGFYNAKGEWVVTPQFDGARDFKNGYASVRVGEKWGVIDTSGNWVIEPVFEDIKDVEIVR